MLRTNAVLKIMRFAAISVASAWSLILVGCQTTEPATEAPASVQDGPRKSASAGEVVQELGQYKAPQYQALVSERLFARGFSPMEDVALEATLQDRSVVNLRTHQYILLQDGVFLRRKGPNSFVESAGFWRVDDGQVVFDYAPPWLSSYVTRHHAKTGAGGGTESKFKYRGAKMRLWTNGQEIVAEEAHAIEMKNGSYVRTTAMEVQPGGLAQYPARGGPYHGLGFVAGQMDWGDEAGPVDGRRWWYKRFNDTSHLSFRLPGSGTSCVGMVSHPQDKDMPIFAIACQDGRRVEGDYQFDGDWIEIDEADEAGGQVNARFELMWPTLHPESKIN